MIKKILIIVLDFFILISRFWREVLIKYYNGINNKILYYNLINVYK